MALPCTVQELERNKFLETLLGKVAVRVVLTDPLNPGEGLQNRLPVEIFPNEAVFNTYSEANAVSASSEADILTYTVPVGQALYLGRVEVGGDNYARYSVLVDNSPIDKIRTWWGNFDGKSDFDGLKLLAGTEIKIKVDNFRNSSADFNARILGVLL